MTLKDSAIIGGIVVMAIASLIGAFHSVTVNLPQQQSQQYGSVSGPDSYFDYYNENGVVKYNRVMKPIAATTTPCTFKSPNATTSLEVFTLNVTTATSPAATFVLATSTVTNATTSLISNVGTLSASAQGFFIWHAGTNNSIVAPNTYVSLGAQNGGAATALGYTFGGLCTATFRQI